MTGGNALVSPDVTRFGDGAQGQRMLTDPKEIEIISGAIQKNVRDPARSREHFHNILADFFQGVRLSGVYLDMGPGQYDFGMMVRQQGGDCHAIDFDPAVVALGVYKGFNARLMRIQALADQPLERTFDGLFNKFTLNAFWEGSQRSLIRAIAGHMAPDAWAWIGPWNGLPKTSAPSADDALAVLAEQRALFEEHGFGTHILSDHQARRYGIHGAVANNVVFTKNLTWRAV
jgi:hypothetical protein